MNALKKRGLTGEELRRIMWGRASISSPAKVSKKYEPIRQNSFFVIVFFLFSSNRKPRDAADLYGTAATGGAINSAMDVMNFAADIVVPVNGTMTPASLAPKTLKQNELNSGAAQPKAQHSVDFKDPLRELVLIAETIGVDGETKDTAVLSSVNSLANQAAVLEHVQEVRPVSLVQQTGAVPALGVVPTGGTGSTTLNLFQDPKDMVDPVKEQEFLRRLEQLEDGDSEGIDGNITENRCL